MAGNTESASGGGASGPILVIGEDPLVLPLAGSVSSSSGHEILRVDTAAEADALLAARPVSLILLNATLPDRDVRAWLTGLRASPRTFLTPIVMLADPGQGISKAEVMDLGADDFFEKPPDSDTLRATIRQCLRRLEAFSDRAARDPLTGLPGLDSFREDFRRTASLTARARLPLSLAIVDIDHFRSMNESHGRPVGDEVLRRTAAFLQKTLRTSDLLARGRDDRFLLLLPNTRTIGALQAVDKIRDAIRREAFAGAGGSFALTLSAGVTEIRHGTPFETAFADAEQALRRAKEEGRDRSEARAEIVAVRNRILLAEDDALVAMLVQHRLTREGFEVVHFANGADAFAAAPLAAASLIILDVKMPGMDGFEVLARLRAQPAFSRTPIMMFTGMGNEDDIVRGFSLGADDYVIKPFSAAELIARIRRLVSKA